MLFAQLTHAIGLNDVCDSLRLCSGPLSSVRGATPPSRNNLSHANKVRPVAMAEGLFWEVLEHLRQRPGFAAGSGKRLAHRFKAAIHVVDSTTIQLIATCLDWAKHRRRKAAAKCHLRLDLHSHLPRFVLIDTAREADAKRGPELCAGLRQGEIVIFDKAYMDLIHLYGLEQRGVWWITRAKENMQYRVVKRRQHKPQGKILRDEEIILTGQVSHQRYGARLRRVVALVELDGVEQEMVFLTNNFDWAASSVAELYRCRWQIEVFFKQIKQTLQLADFLGNSANAVRWQLWMALLTYVLLRYQAFLSGWGSSFVRLWAVVRSGLWLKLDLVGLLKSYGTAGGDFRLLGQPEQAYLPGFRAEAVG
jgi:Transposase DDE domain